MSMRVRKSLSIAAALLLVGTVAPALATGVMFVKNNKVGIGIDTPAHLLHVFDSTGKTFIVSQNSGAGTDSVAVLRSEANVAKVNFQAHGSGRTISRFGKTLGNWSEFLSVGGNGLIVGTTAGPLVLGAALGGTLEMASDGSLASSTGASLTAGGAWTNASSRELKQDVRSLTAEESLAAFAQLEPVSFRYKSSPSEQMLGFIAEDVPELVAIESRKGLSSMDIVALLTKVVQEQQSTIDELSARLSALEGQ